MYNTYGDDWESHLFRRQEEIIDGMTRPVRCAFCSRIYDLGAVEVTARYTDCTMWRTPCCNRLVDDRGESGWKSLQDYYCLTQTDTGVWIDPRP